MSMRSAFGYVVGVEGSDVVINLNDSQRGRMSAVTDGAAPVTQVGALFGIIDGHQLLIAMVRSIHFAEPAAAHRAGVGTTTIADTPLRQLRARITGTLTSTRAHNGHRFERGGVFTPALGAETVPLAHSEVGRILSAHDDLNSTDSLHIGTERFTRLPVSIRTDDLLPRHTAILGATGQGKSCLTAALLQQMFSKYSSMRCVIFDINGEYDHAFRDDNGKLHDGVRLTHLGDKPAGHHASANEVWDKISYHELGRVGLEQLLLPSERTQAPALRFAINALPYIQCQIGVNVRAGLIGQKQIFRTDCNGSSQEIREASNAIDQLHQPIQNQLMPATHWPAFAALAPLVSDYGCLKNNKRDAFSHGHVYPLVRRVDRYVFNDPAFHSVVDIDPQTPIPLGKNPLAASQEQLVERFFGVGQTPPDWRIHIINLRSVAQDLLPFILSSLLGVLQTRLYELGQGNIPPTLLVLDEAHHYLRPSDKDDDSSHLAYERLAKEGRKFGISLWVSTQRPSEVSPTVLAQCGTWFCMRLSSEQDLRAVQNASEWADPSVLGRIRGLPRQEALAFGAALPIPVHLRVPTASPTPNSSDPLFTEKWSS